KLVVRSKCRLKCVVAIPNSFQSNVRIHDMRVFVVVTEGTFADKRGIVDDFAHCTSGPVAIGFSSWRAEWLRPIEGKLIFPPIKEYDFARVFVETNCPKQCKPRIGGLPIRGCTDVNVPRRLPTKCHPLHLSPHHTVHAAVERAICILRPSRKGGLVTLGNFRRPFDQLA